MDTTSECDLLIQRGCFSNLGPTLQSIFATPRTAFILSQAPIFNLYGEMLKRQLTQGGWQTTEYLIPAGEESKNMRQAENCWQKMEESGLDRQCLVIALGGGVVSDLAGFVAGCYMRGVDTLYLPTTLMGMVDAAHGGKTGINFAGKKNLIGLFHQPKLIVIDPWLLKTLPAREFLAGVAEVIKYGVTEDAEFFAFLEQQMKNLLKREDETVEKVIKHCSLLKRTIVKEDFKDRHARERLNYGHTFAHAIEAVTDYQKYLHGEAVAIGMSCAAHLSERLGLTDAATVARQDALCLAAGLPISLPPLPTDKLIEAMEGDKKGTDGKINLILPQAIGDVLKIKDVEKSLIREILLTKMVG